MTGPKFHPDLRLARLTPREAVTPGTLWLGRLVMRLAGALMPRRSRRVRLGNGRSVWMHVPKGKNGPRPVLFWIHGGGLIFGHPVQDDRFCAALARRTGAIVAMPDYRFAPEHPYPAALDDVAAALAAVLARPDVDPRRLALGGDSAGGGLAACLAIRLRDAGGPMPVLQVLHEPMLDEASRFRPDPDPASLRMWSARLNRFSWDGYLGDLAGPVPATASAARLEDARGLPAAWIGVGTADLFHDECLAYAAKLSGAGVPVETEIVPGAHHGFLATAPRAPVCRAYVDRMVEALLRAFA